MLCDDIISRRLAKQFRTFDDDVRCGVRGALQHSFAFSNVINVTLLLAVPRDIPTKTTTNNHRWEKIT